MMIVLQLLSLFTISVSSVSSNSLFFVPHVNSTWKTAQPEDLYCPKSSHSIDLESLRQIPLPITFQRDHHELAIVEGFLCYGLKYNVHCSEGFFGTRTLTKTITKVEVNQNSCSATIHKYQQGALRPPYFPEESCSWMGEQDNSIEFYLVTPHPVQFDPYKVDFVDELFENGICSQNYCETVHENTAWLALSPKRLECSRFYPSNLDVYYDQSHNIKYVKFEEHIVPYSSRFCLKTYCNIVGLRLSNGLFVGLPRLDIFKTLRKCEPSELVSYQPVESKLTEIELILEEDRRRMDCFEAVRHIKKNRNPSFYDLSLLEPQTAGVHNVYRLNNSTLEVTKGVWEPISNFDFSQRDSIGTTAQGKMLRWTEWVPSGKPGILAGFNGVHKVMPSHEVIIPRLEIIKSFYKESMFLSHNLTMIKEPHVKHLEHEGLDGPVTSLTSKNQIDVGTWITNVWNNFWGKFMGGIFVIFSLIVFILILWCCVKRQRGRRSTSQKDEEAPKQRSSKASSGTSVGASIPLFPLRGAAMSQDDKTPKSKSTKSLTRGEKTRQGRTWEETSFNEGPARDSATSSKVLITPARKIW